MLARIVLCGSALVLSSSAALAQGSFVSPNLTGFASGAANPLPGTGGSSLTYNQSPSGPAANATSFSGGTSGGLGDDPTFVAGFAQLTLKGNISPTTLDRGGTTHFQAVFNADGLARFDPTKYSGSISANLQVQGEIDIAGAAGIPVPYFLALTPSFAGNFRLYSVDAGQNQIDVPTGQGTLLPGMYFFQFSGNLTAGSGQGQSSQSAVSGVATLTVPSPGGAGMLSVAAGVMLITGLRRRH